MLLLKPSDTCSSAIETHFPLSHQQNVDGCLEEQLTHPTLTRKFSEVCPFTLTTSSIHSNVESINLQELIDGSFISQEDSRNFLTLDITSLIVNGKTHILIDSMAEVISCHGRGQLSF